MLLLPEAFVPTIKVSEPKKNWTPSKLLKSARPTCTNLAFNSPSLQAHSHASPHMF